jgi:two-component system NtrC family sensor kinase
VEGSAVALTNDPGPTIRIAAAEGTLAELVGHTLSEADAAIVAAAIGQERLQVSDIRSGQPPWSSVVQVRQAAAAPLRAHGVTLGALIVVDRAGGAFRDEDLRFLSTVATHAAIVLANARFFDLIRAGKEQWETTFDALVEGIAVTDENGKVRRANRSLAELLGASLPAVIGLDLGSKLGAPREVGDLFAATLQGASHPAITVRSKALGRILRITAAAIGSESPGWVVALIEDVTEQKTMETQLIQNEKMVAVGQLVSGVAHELNNPLTSIAGLSEFLLEQGSTTEKDRDHLRVIQEQAERAGRIVRNLLTFARKGPSDLGDVDLNDIVQRTVLLIGYELKLRDVRLDTELSRTLPMVRGDRYELQQVVLNLLTNAVHAVAQNPVGKPRHIQLATSTTGDQVQVRVTDTGPGIAPEHMANLFSPFFTTKESGQGTGLGLSISFGIVERHGGRLSAVPSHEGATFVITLPATKRTVSGTTQPRAERPSAPGDGNAKLPRDVLLVDEDPAVQRMIRALFSRDGQKVATPRNAVEAIRQIEQRRFDLIIADARAAVSSGETFATVLLNRWPELRSRIILITADVRPETDEWLRGLGCSYFLKPFKVSDLKEAAAKIANGNSLYHKAL